MYTSIIEGLVAQTHGEKDTSTFYYADDSKADFAQGHAFKLKKDGIRTYKEGTTTYYLKGIRLKTEGTNSNNSKEQHFYINESFLANPKLVEKNSNKTTSQYSKVNGTKEKKDTFAGHSVAYKKLHTFELDETKVVHSKDNGKNDITELNNKKYTTMTDEEDGLTGAKTYDQLVDYMADIIYSNTVADNDVYLIYEKQGGGATELEITNNVYVWDDNSGYVIDENYTKTKTAETVLNSSEHFSLSDAPKGYNKPFLNIGNGEIKHYVKDVTIEYLGSDQSVKTETSTLSVDGSDDGIWNGDTKLGKKFDSGASDFMKGCKTKSPVVKGSTIKVVVNYYQPKAVYSSAKYFRHMMDCSGTDRIRWSYIHTGNEAVGVDKLSSNSSISLKL